MDSVAPPSQALPPKPTFACVRCSDRKVRCNREVPCNACVKHRAQCIYRPPRPPRRRKNLALDEVLVERLRHYEHLLQERGINPEHPHSSSEHRMQEQMVLTGVSDPAVHVPPPGSTSSGLRPTVFKPEVIQGRGGTRLVDNSLWSRVAAEIDENDEPTEEDSGNDTSDDLPSGDDFTYVLDAKTPKEPPMHPPIDQIHELWEIFLENVDPLSKIIHVPTMRPAIEKAAADVNRIPRGFEALMFAIYSVAILSLTDKDCVSRFSESRSILLKRYVSATKTALARAKFMSTTSLVVIQALHFHLMSIRDYGEPRAIWNLTGVVMRVAQGMGMRIDGTLLGLSPFETELRRRLWWQLNMHEFRAAELCGQSKYRDFRLDETTPKAVANVADKDLYPAMTSPPVESTRPTEMMWCKFRNDLATFGAGQQERIRNAGKTSGMTSEDFIASDDLKMKDKFLQELEDTVETKYIRFCDPSDPLHLMTLVGGRLALNLSRFLTHHPRRWAQQERIPEEEKKFVWDVVKQLLQQYDMIQSSPQLTRFAWNISYFIQWHAVIHALDLLRAEPQYPDAEKAWRLIEALYRNNEEMLLETDRPILVTVGNLCLKAYSAREAMLAREGKAEQVPGYVARLRERREQARAKKQASLQLRSKGRDAVLGTNEATPPVTQLGTSTLDAAQAQQHPSKQHSLDSGSDDYSSTFWFNDTIGNDAFAPNSMDMMDLDTQDYGLGEASGELIDWTQLDAWLGGVDPLLPKHNTLRR